MEDVGEICTLRTAGLNHQPPQFRTRDYRCQLRKNTEQELKQGGRLFTHGTRPGTAGARRCFAEGLTSSESFSFMKFFCEAFETLHLLNIKFKAKNNNSSGLKRSKGKVLIKIIKI